MRGSSGRFGSNPVEESKLGVEADIEARGDFERRILEDVRTASTTPCHNGLVTHPQQCCDLWAEESKHRADPPVEGLRRLDLRDSETVEHADVIVGAKTG
jgi:hypothetical protein